MKSQTYPKDMLDLPEFRQFCDDMRQHGLTVVADKGFPFVHVVDPDIYAKFTEVETDSFEEAGYPGTFCLHPVSKNGETLAH